MTPAAVPAGHKTQFYQCSNPACGLRFPAPVIDLARPRLCPRCKNPASPVPTRQDVEQYNPRQEHRPNHAHHEVLLDNIRSTFNVGAMLRTSDGAGVQKVHLSGITPQPGNPRISKVALGAEYSIPWEYHPSGVQAATDAKSRGLQLWALEIHPRGVSIFEIPPETRSQPAMLVAGNEVSGIDPEILAICDQFFWIPMEGYKRSLNVAVAFGIAVYSLRYSGNSG